MAETRQGGRRPVKRRPAERRPVDRGVDESLSRYQSGTASDEEMAALMQRLINTGSIQALQGAGLGGEAPPQVWATIIPVGRSLDVWVDGERRSSASNATLARYRVVAAARPAKVTWTDPFTARWDRPRGS